MTFTQSFMDELMARSAIVDVVDRIGEPLRRGARMRLVLGPVVPAQPGDDGLVAMVQACADFFTAVLSDHAEDWHLLQPFFDVPARRTAAVA